jgi:AGZA family xanthine/uracil permease-like MFS transporter
MSVSTDDVGTPPESPAAQAPPTDPAVTGAPTTGTGTDAAVAAPTGGPVAAHGRLDRYFEITARGSTVRREVLAGLTTFATMAYIVVLNPLIIGTAPDHDGNLLGIAPVAGVTALVAAVMTILMGVVGKVPFALATGLGLNAFVAFSVASRMSWPQAMGLVVIEGLIIALLVLTGFRQAVFRAIPHPLKAAIAAGIGLFIALIGLVDGGVVRRVPDAAHTTVPVQLGTDGTLHGWPTVVFIVGLLLTGGLVARRVRGGILLGILATTALAAVVNALVHPGAAFVDGRPNPTGWQLNVPTLPHPLLAGPDLHLVGHVSFAGYAQVGVATVLLLLFTLVLADFFDVMGTTVGLARQAGLATPSGEIPRLGRVLFVDGVAAAAGGGASASSATTYIESSSGIADGGRTGLTSVVTGVLFLGALLLTPLVSLVPSEAAGPALVVVGALMVRQVRDIDLTDLGVALPAFLTMVLMPFTYSITNGIGAGFVSWVVIQVVRGQARRVHPLMWAVTAAFLVYFGINLFGALAG